MTSNGNCGIDGGRNTKPNTEQDGSATRRDTLRNIAITAGAIPFTGVGAAESLNTNNEINNKNLKTLRGSFEKPITGKEIRDTRKGFINKRNIDSLDNSVMLNPNQTFGKDQILAYNIILHDDTVPREQFVVMGGVKNPDQHFRTAKLSSKHAKADDMLQEALNSQVKSVDEAATTDYDIEWNEWDRKAITDTNYHFPEDVESIDPDDPNDVAFGARPGAINVNIDVRESSEDQRVAARADLRMEAGDQLCRNGEDEYCIGDEEGYRNKNYEVIQDWDKPANSVSGENLLRDVEPGNMDGQKDYTHTATLRLHLSENPSVVLGYSKSMSFDETEIIDHTTLTESTFAHHELDFYSKYTDTSKRSAEIVVSSVAESDFSSCKSGYNGYWSDYLEVDIQAEWWSGESYPYTHDDNVSFNYETRCFF